MADKGNAQSFVDPQAGVEASNDPETFLTQVNDDIDKVEAAINKFIDAATHWVNDQIASHAGLLGGIGGSVIGGIVGGPIGGIVGGIGGEKFGDHEAKALKDKLDTLVDKINAAWEQAEQDITRAIGSILGNPLKMSQIASGYRDAAEYLGKYADNPDNSALTEWQFSGHAAGAYSLVRGGQAKAFAGLQTQLLAAAKQLDSDEATLLNYWNQQLWNLIKFVADATKDAGDAPNVGNAVTAETGPIIKLIGDLGGTAGNILNAWVANWVATNVSSAGSWDGLNSGLGANGLPDGKWPPIDGQHRAEMNTSWGFKS